MVEVAREIMETAALADITSREVQQYAGFSDFAKLYPILDDKSQTYAVVIIEDDPAARPASVVVMARVVGDHIIIDEDTTDKPLVDALMVNGGVPRQQIVLAYRGESLPVEVNDAG
jgi:XisI protein